MSDQRYDAPDTAVVATAAAAVVARSPRVGYVPARANALRDGVAVALLIVALLLPWNLDIGVGIPVGNGLLIAVVVAVTLLAILAALMPHVGPFRLTAPNQDVRRTSRIRLLLTIAYLIVAVGFVVYQLSETWRGGGTGLVPPGVGPGLLLGVGGALLASQPPITSITIQDNGFRRWYAAARMLGAVSIALATLSVAFNVYWRLRYLFVTNGAFGGEDIATIITTLLYGAEALIALVIASRWLTERTAAARLATAALGRLGRAGGHAGVDPSHRPRRRRLPRLRAEHLDGRRRLRGLPVLGGRGRDRRADDALRHLPDQAADAGGLPLGSGEDSDAHRVLGVRGGRAARRRLSDRLVAGSPPRPVRHRRDDGVQPDHRLDRAVAAPPTRQRRGRLPVIAAFSGLLFVFTVANLAIGVALAPRYAEASPNAVYGNNLAQQITSTFDVTICLLSFAVLVAMLFTGPLAGYLVRRRDARTARPRRAPLPRLSHRSPRHRRSRGPRNPLRCRELFG